MKSTKSYVYDISETASESASESISESDVDSDVDQSYGDYGDEHSDEDMSPEEIEKLRPEPLPKKGRVSKKEQKLDIPKLKDLNENILKRFKKGKLEQIAKKYGLDAKIVANLRGKRGRNPTIDDYIEIILNFERYGYSREKIEEEEDPIEDTGEDAEGTNISVFEGVDVSHMKPYQLKNFMEMKNPVKDKRKYKIGSSELMNKLVKKGLVDPESLYYYVWVDISKAKRPQKEESVVGASYFFPESNRFGDNPYYMPPDKVPTGPIKMISDEPVYGRSPPPVLKPVLPPRGPPRGYESFKIGERVAFLGDEVYEGFLTRADGPAFYISGVKEPFYYEKVLGKIPTVIPSPEFSYIIPVTTEEFAKHLGTIKNLWPDLARIYENQQLNMIEEKIIGPKIVGLVWNKGSYSWVYDFTINPADLSKELIPVIWGSIKPNYDSITQYVSVAKDEYGLIEGTVIGFVKDNVRIRVDYTRKIMHVPLGDPSLKIIPGKGEGINPVIPTRENILSSPVFPDMRLAVVNKLFDNFAKIIPGLIEKEGKSEKGEEEDIPPPFISVFRTWDEYFNGEFQIWLRTKYIPGILKELPYDELKRKAYEKATMGLGKDDLNMIHNRWGLDLVNSLDENYRKRLAGWGVERANEYSFYHSNRDGMLKYLQNSKNKTVFEIEIERGLYGYQPYQPPQPTKGFKLEEARYMKSSSGEKGVVDQDPRFISTNSSKPQDPRVTMMMERNKLAVALTNMIRSFMIKFPISENKIYEELLEEETHRRYSKLIPWSEEDRKRLTKVEIDEGVERLSRDRDEFTAMYEENLKERYRTYEKEWNRSLVNPTGNVKKIIVKQEIIDRYEENLKELREREKVLQEDPDNPGKMIPEFTLPGETRRLLDIIKGDREILEDSIQRVRQEIQILGSSPRTRSLTMKGHDVRSEIKEFERNCMVVISKGPQEHNTVKSYLEIVLYPLIFTSASSNVSIYSKIFRSKIANRTYHIRSLLNFNLLEYFPEFYMKDNSKDIVQYGKEAILNVRDSMVSKFVQDFINAKYLGPRRIEPIPEKIDFGLWKLATISPQEVCERQTESGKTLARIGYQEQYYKKQKLEKISMDGGLLEKRIVTETEIPLYKTIEDGNLIIDQNPDNKKFSCFSKPEIILQIAAALKDNPYQEVIIDPRTGYPYSSVFIDRMKTRYEKEIEQSIADLPENFVLRKMRKMKKIDQNRGIA